MCQETKRASPEGGQTCAVTVLSACAFKFVCSSL